MKNQNEKIEISINDRNSEILKKENLKENSKMNSKQKFFIRYLKSDNENLKIDNLKKNLDIKDSTAKAWVSRFNQNLKFPKFAKKIEKKEESEDKK